MSDVILFLCTGNACRSPMAEGFGRAHLPESYDIYSAGVRPIGVDERACLVMEELEIDIRQQSSNGIDAVPDNPDQVISMSDPAARLAAQHFDSSIAMEQWDVHDPYGARGTREEQLNEFRDVRDTIQNRMTKKWPVLFPSKNDSNRN